MASPVTVVVDIDAGCFAAAAVPLEDKPPLSVDADRMKPFQPAAQLLEMIGWAARVNPDRSSRRRASEVYEKAALRDLLECFVSGHHP
jgi:hypothetical protein